MKQILLLYLTIPLKDIFIGVASGLVTISVIIRSAHAVIIVAFLDIPQIRGRVGPIQTLVSH